jgi:hypothetical protein
MEIGWWAWLLPWSAVVAVGNWRAGVAFTRRTQASFQPEVEALRSAPQGRALAPEAAAGGAAGGATAGGAAANAAVPIPRAVPVNVAPVTDPPTLYYSTALPMSCAVQVTRNQKP